MSSPTNETSSTGPEDEPRNILACADGTRAPELPARYRRIQATAFDISDAGEFGISSIRHGVAAPPFHKEPLQHLWQDKNSQTISYAFGSKIRQEAVRIARGEGVKPFICDDSDDSDEDDFINAFALAPITFPGVKMASYATIRILAHWESDDVTPQSWERAVRRIKKSVDHERMLRPDTRDIDVSVEIVAPETMMRIEVNLITNEDLQSTNISEQSWTLVKKYARCTFDRHEGMSHITSISLLRRGPITIYITVDYESNLIMWPLIIDDIQAFLHNHNHRGVVVHVEYNEFDGDCNIPMAKYTSPANLGDDIGAAQHTPGLKFEEYNPDLTSWMTEADRQWNIAAYRRGIRQPLPTLPSHPPPIENTGPKYGTLGCWLEIKTRSNPTTWIKVALTSYHAMRSTISGFASDKTPPDDSDLAKADTCGIKHHVAPTTSSVSHPAWTSHAYWHNKAETRMRDPDKYIELKERRGWEDEYDNQAAFISQAKHMVGQLWYASGYGRCSPTGDNRPDWALIMPPNQEQVGNNEIPRWRESAANYRFKGLKGDTMCLGSPREGGLKGMEQGARVFKVGPWAGRTTARLGTLLKLDVRLPRGSGTKTREYTLTEEFVFVGQDLVDGGEAGSVLFDAFGSAVGMVLPGGSLTPQKSNQKLACVTPMDDVLADIVAFSEGEITEARVAQTEIKDVEENVWRWTGMDLKRLEELERKEGFKRLEEMRQMKEETKTEPVKVFPVDGDTDEWHYEY